MCRIFQYCLTCLILWGQAFWEISSLDLEYPEIKGHYHYNLLVVATTYPEQLLVLCKIKIWTKWCYPEMGIYSHWKYLNNRKIDFAASIQFAAE